MTQNDKPSDDQILEWLQTPREVSKGLERIYRLYADGLGQFVLQNGGSQAEADDIFQEVVVTFVWSVQQDKFQRASSIKTYLTAINRNLWFNELKRRARASAREREYAGGLDKEPGLAQGLEQREARRHLMEIIGALGDTCKKILVSFYYEKQSMKEILTSLDYENEQVVRNKKYKCLKKLEEMIDSHPGLREQLKKTLYG